MILPQFWRDHLDIRGGTTASSNPRGGRSLATLGCSEETPHAEVAPAAGFLFAACLLNQRMAASGPCSNGLVVTSAPEFAEFARELNVFVLLARLSKSMGDSANSLFNGAGWLLLLLEDAVQRDDLSARYPSNAPRYPRQVRWRGAVPVGGGEITRRSHSLDCADDHRWSERTRGCEETNLADVKTRMHGPIHDKHPP
jgi:hypothetical protein